MTLVILSLHTHRGDIFIAFIFLGIVWLLAHVMWGLCMRNRAAYRDISDRAKAERKKTIIHLPDHRDPAVFGDVPHVSPPCGSHPYARGIYPASRPNSPPLGSSAINRTNVRGAKV